MGVVSLSHIEEEIKCLRLSNSNRLLACGPTSVLVWNMRDLFPQTSGHRGRMIGEASWFRHDNINECAFHRHSGDRIVGVACRSGLVLVLDIEANVRIEKIELDSCVNLFEFAQFNSNIVLISSGNSLICHDFRARQRVQLIRAEDHRAAFVDICGLDDQPFVLLGEFFFKFV